MKILDDALIETHTCVHCILYLRELYRINITTTKNLLNLIYSNLNFLSREKVLSFSSVYQNKMLFSRNLCFKHQFGQLCNYQNQTASRINCFIPLRFLSFHKNIKTGNNFKWECMHKIHIDGHSDAFSWMNFLLFFSYGQKRQKR